MTKYKIVLQTHTIEFSTLQDAEQFKLDNDLEVEIEEFTETIVAALIYPDLTARQIRIGLLGVGVNLTDVDAAIESLNEPQKSYAKISWEYATIFERHNELIDALGASLELTTEQINQIFLDASQL